MEDLNKEGITDVEICSLWSQRRQRMALRRQYFESLWRSGIESFFQGIIGESINGSRPLYNTLYEQYDFSLFSRDGMRFDNIKYPLLHSIVMRAMASEVPNKPKINFIAQGTNDQTKPIAFRHLFDQVLYEMNADQEDFEIFLDKRIFGSSIVMVYTDQYEVNIKDPVWEKGSEEITYEKKTKKIKQCKYRKLDLRHVYLDEHCSRTDLEDCMYAQYDEFYSKEEFMIKFAKYGEEKCKMAASAEVGKDEATVYYNWYDTKDASFVRVTHCFDKLNDLYHIIAGAGTGILLNEKDSPIPRIAGRRGKDIPLALAIQYKIPGAPYGYADAHVTRSFNQIKNIIRVMILEITQKSAKPTMAVDPLSNFDEQGFEWGQDFIRVSPKDLQEISIHPDLKSLYDLDNLTDEDIIRVTGINISDTSNNDDDETARKTIIRRESQVALVELVMNYMSSSFFTRLYTLMKDEVRLHYGLSLKNGEKIKVRSKGVLVTRGKNGELAEEKQSGFRYFDIKEGDVDLDLELDLELGNIASSRELEKAIIGESLQTIGAFAQNFNGAGIAEYIAEGYDMPDTVLNKPQGKIAGADPKQLANSQIPQSLLPQQEQQMQQMMSQPGPQQPSPQPNAQAPAPTPAAS